MRKTSLGLAILAAIATHAAAQIDKPPAAVKPPLAFDVASVKAFDPKDSGVARYSTGTAMGMREARSLEGFIENAYGFDDTRIVGETDWMKTDTYEVAAKTSAPSTSAQKKEMLRTLLEDRFKLATHHETRVMAEYSLVVVKGGAKVNAVDPGADRGSSSGPGMLKGSLAISEIAGFLALQLHRPVVDKTGMNGLFNVQLTYAPNDQADGPSIFTALQEQLGLKLEVTKGPIDVLVIDHVERPLAD